MNAVSSADLKVGSYLCSWFIYFSARKTVREHDVGVAVGRARRGFLEERAGKMCA
jgi:hypothetical protein